MEKILLVEDDRSLSVGLKYSFEKEGYLVVPAGGVREGERFFGEGGFALVILDIGLPDGSGFELCRSIRKISTVPILFLTACDEEINVVMGLEMGGDEYIAKPFRLRELLSRVKALLRRSGAAAGRVCSDGFVLDAEKCRLFGASGEIALTPAEYRLLFVLMSNPNRVLPRERLITRLWDDGGDYVDANTLTVYIRRLREKIERDPSDPKLLVTVRGVGYQWREDAGYQRREGAAGEESENETDRHR